MESHKSPVVTFWQTSSEYYYHVCFCSREWSSNRSVQMSGFISCVWEKSKRFFHHHQLSL